MASYIASSLAVGNANHKAYNLGSKCDILYFGPLDFSVPIMYVCWSNSVFLV